MFLADIDQDGEVTLFDVSQIEAIYSWLIGDKWGERMKRCLHVFSLILVAVIAFSVASISASAITVEDLDDYFFEIDTNVDTTYEDEIKPYFYPEIYKGVDFVWIQYNMLYAHNADNGEAPEYVVFKVVSGAGQSASITKEFDNCIILSANIEFPYELGCYVYVPSHQKVYTLEEAYYSEDLDISAALKSGRIGHLRGDVNLDRSRDIFDATYLQRYLAGYKDCINTRCMDVDLSGEVNIIDATKIQRYIAGLQNSFVSSSSVES